VTSLRAESLEEESTSPLHPARGARFSSGTLDRLADFICYTCCWLQTERVVGHELPDGDLRRVSFTGRAGQPL